MAKKTKKKKKQASREVELFDVILSYPDLHDPKPFKGKTYYRVDGIMGKKHPDLKVLRDAIEEVCIEQFGDDESEWPESIKGVQDGNEREDSKGYKGNFFVTASTQTPVDVIDDAGDRVAPKAVRGGMKGNIALTVKAWEFDGDEGVSIYLNGVQVDPDQEFEAFGGGKSVKKRFGVDKDDDDEDESPRKKKKRSRDEDEDDEEDEAPRKKKKKSRDDDEEDDEDADDEDDYQPPKKKKRARDDDEDEDEEDDEEDEKPRKSSKKKRRSRDEDEDDED